ncbi:hypothetical protein ACOMHN_042686 [Nucella lapillus]
MNTNAEVDGGDGSDSRKDLSELSTLANHKQYLQLVPSTLSDEDEEYDPVSSPTSLGEGEGEGETIPLSVDPAERDQQMTQWTEELEKIEGEIGMLRQVLGSKVRRANELKRNLGITPFREFKHDLQAGLSQIKESNTYQKTSDTIHDWNEKISHTSAYQKTSAVVKTASEKTTSAFSTVGAAVSRKLGDLKNSQAFKSMEEKVSSSYANVKTSRSIEGLKEKLSKVTGSKSTDDIDAAVHEVKEQEPDYGEIIRW